MGQPADVFISYSREDKDKVLELTAKLSAAGVPIWMDVGGIDGATQWGEEIVNALERAKVLLLMVSESAVRSHNVACLYSQLGEKRRAIDTLREAIKAGVENFGWIKNDTNLAALRDDPEFLELVEGK